MMENMLQEKKLNGYIQQQFEHIKIFQLWKILKRQCFNHTACQIAIPHNFNSLKRRVLTSEKIQNSIKQ